MIEINIEDIKEVKFCWDWQDAIIPKKYIKKIIYNEVKKDNYSIYCDYIALETNLEYIKTHKLCISDGKELEESIYDGLQEKNIWDIEIIYNNEKKSIKMNLPSNRKDIYCSEEQYIIGWDAKNLCEHHNIQNNNYIIEWIEPEKKDIYMNQKEMSIFFKKGNLSKISDNTHCLGIEMFDRILELNMKEKSITDNIEQLSQKDGGGILVFDNFKKNVLKIIHRLHNVNHHRKAIYGIKEGYTCTEEYYPLCGTDILILNAKNHAHHWNFSFVLVEKIDNEEDKENLYNVIIDGEPNADTKNYFSRTILIFNDNINVEQCILDFYRKIHNNRNKIEITNETLLFTTNKEINKIWYDIHKEWDLL